MPLRLCRQDTRFLDGLTREIRSSAALAKVNDLARNTVHLMLTVLVRTDLRSADLFPAGGHDDLPRFCRLLRSTSLGEKRCRTCRSLVAFGACYRGPIQYACHGGTSILAAPGVLRQDARSDRLVVAACAVGRNSHARGWRVAAPHLAGLGLDARQLKDAYHELPVFSEGQLVLAQEILGLAATVLGEIEVRAYNGRATDPSEMGDSVLTPPDDLPHLPLPLADARHPAFRPKGSGVGSAMVDMVVAMVRRDPCMRYSVFNIARAACVTPNHFSSVFHKCMGQTFCEFLASERVALACTLLDDPSLSVAEVARRSGFDDPAYFSRRFKKITGHSPSDWRNNSMADSPAPEA